MYPEARFHFDRLVGPVKSALKLLAPCLISNIALQHQYKFGEMHPESLFSGLGQGDYVTDGHM